MFWIPIAMAAMSLAKNAQDQAQQQRDKYVEAAKARYSPWTGIKPGQVHYAQPASNLMQGFGSIMAYKQGQDRNDQLNQLLNAKLGQHATPTSADTGSDASSGGDIPNTYGDNPMGGTFGNGSMGGSFMASPEQSSAGGNDELQQVLEKIMNKGGGGSIWKSLMASNGDGTESQPTPILGSGLSSFYS